DGSEDAPATPTRHDGLDPDLRRLVTHLPEGLHPTLALLSGPDLPAPRRSGETMSSLITLTAAEERALRALAGPGTLAEVAATLHVSRNTLKTQVSGLYRKMDASSRAETIAQARRHGLLPDA